jgi:hypothetical protein
MLTPMSYFRVELSLPLISFNLKLKFITFKSKYEICIIQVAFTSINSKINNYIQFIFN